MDNDSSSGWRGLCAHAFGHLGLSPHYLYALGLATLPGIATVPAMQHVDLDLTDARAVNELAELRRALARAGIPLDRFRDRCLREFDPYRTTPPPPDWTPPRPHTKTMPMLDTMIRTANEDPTGERRDGRAIPRPVHLLTALLSSPDIRVSAILQDVGVDRASALAALSEPDVSWHVDDMIEGRYQVLTVITAGGMGDVYQVLDHHQQIHLAVKSPRADLLSSPGLRDAFEDEAQTWLGLGAHPHLVTCRYVRRYRDVPRVFADWMPGGSLHDVIADGSLYAGSQAEVLSRVLRLAAESALGLAHIHSRGLLHQDVKPHNIMIDARVTDVGLCRAWSGQAGQAPSLEGAELTSTVRAPFGGLTPAYCSPEQFVASFDQSVTLGRATDVWSWAVSVLDMFASFRDHVLIRMQPFSPPDLRMVGVGRPLVLAVANPDVALAYDGELVLALNGRWTPIALPDVRQLCVPLGGERAAALSGDQWMLIDFQRGQAQPVGPPGAELAQAHPASAVHLQSGSPPIWRNAQTGRTVRIRSDGVVEVYDQARVRYSTPALTETLGSPPVYAWLSGGTLRIALQDGRALTLTGSAPDLPPLFQPRPTWSSDRAHVRRLGDEAAKLARQGNADQARSLIRQARAIPGGARDLTLTGIERTLGSSEGRVLLDAWPHHVVFGNVRGAQLSADGALAVLAGQVIRTVDGSPVSMNPDQLGRAATARAERGSAPPGSWTSTTSADGSAEFALKGGGLQVRTAAGEWTFRERSLLSNGLQVSDDLRVVMTVNSGPFEVGVVFWELVWA